MSSIIETLAALTIGTVESVSPIEIRVLLDLDAPQTTAMNAGSPAGFPRINGYVLIPNEGGALVGQVSFIGIERSPYPKRTGLKDFGVIDLPFPLRKLTVSPVGTLQVTGKRDEPVFRLQRGVSSFPSVGDSVLIPTTEQLRSIVEGQGSDARVKIGTAPLAASANVSFDPDKLFGRHLAVLGNTGSGKSCTVAGVIRWSLEATTKSLKEGTPKPNARFLILDPNGEYAKAFADLNARVFQVPPVTAPSKEFVLPAWFWNSHEWCSFAGAQPGSQRPMLMQAIREMRAGRTTKEPAEARAFRFAKAFKNVLSLLIQKAEYMVFPGTLNCGVALAKGADSLDEHAAGLTGTLAQLVTQAASNCRTTASRNSSLARDGSGRIYYSAFSEPELTTIVRDLDAILAARPSIATDFQGPNEDTPVAFDVEGLVPQLEYLAESGEGASVAQFVSFLVLRLRNLLGDQRMKGILCPESQPTLDLWLNDYIGDDGANNGPIGIVDLSLVPSDVIHVVIAVLGRLVFEATQRYRKLNGAELPTVLVLEEAHTFLKKASDQHDSGVIGPSQMCRETFERIAREGRKFGLGLVISSQRPSELSATVLAQCNTFILHRIVNDEDQRLVGKLVPDNLGGLLGELPNLPSRQAVLLGWATPVPVLVEVRELAEPNRPQSNDPRFWDVWTGIEPRKIDWKAVADDWQGVPPPIPLTAHFDDVPF